MPNILKTILVLIGVIVVLSLVYVLFLRKNIMGDIIKLEPAPDAEVNYIIQSKQVGPFKVGDSIPDTEEYEIQRGKIERFTEEGPEEELAYRAFKDDEEHFLIYADRLNDSIIREIFVQSPHYKTDKGIGINSTLEEFIDTYPDYSLWYTYVSQRYVVETPTLHVQFLLSGDDYEGKLEISSEMTTLEPEDFNDSSRIQMIRLY